MGNSFSLWSDFIRVLVSTIQNPQCDVNKNTMLNTSINNQTVSVVEYLVKNGADVKNPVRIRVSNNYYPSPLIVASKIGNEEIVKLLIFYGAVVNKKCEILGSTPLHIAVTYGNTKVVKLLLENGANPNSLDDKDLTPLHIAINKHSDMVELIKLLLEYGADIDAQDNDGLTPFSLCFKKEFPSVTKELILSYFMM
ncbi:ankyrin repeat protein [Fowlpox virus]|nr:ankyrin repeat protein [Fowlpox virus]